VRPGRQRQGVHDIAGSNGETGVIEMSKLYRPRNGRWIAGVCAGLGKRFGMSPLVVRLLFLLSCILPGPQFILYIVLWVLMPEE